MNSFSTLLASSPGGSRESGMRQYKLLSPSTSADALNIQQTVRPVPLWFATLFPMVPPPFSTITDEEDLSLSTAGGYNTSAAQLFPTSDSVKEFIRQQGVRLQLLTHIRHQMIGDGEKQRKAHMKYAELHLDVKLLIALSDVASFSASALELVHACSSGELAELQQKNVRIMIEILQLLRTLMQTEELKLDLRQVTPEGVFRSTCELAKPPRTNIADRLCAHNSPEIFLQIFEAALDELNQQDDSAAGGGGGGEPSSCAHPPRALKVTLVESVLRCLDTQLRECTQESVHRVNILKQIYLFIPSQLATPPTSANTASPGEGSDSEIIRRLIGIVKDRKSTSTELTVLAGKILNHVASTPIANDHVHSTTCKRPPEREACTKGAPPSPIITYPVYCNSTLAVASKLFLFPHNPALYLVEKGNLLGAYLDILQPFLQHKPSTNASSGLGMFSLERERDHSGSTPKNNNTPKMMGRSLFRSVSDPSVNGMTECGFSLDEDDFSLDSFTSNRIPISPPVPAARVHQVFHHEPHTHQTEEDIQNMHHASFALSEHRFMLDSYTTTSSAPSTAPPSTTTVTSGGLFSPLPSSVNEANKDIMQFPSKVSPSVMSVPQEFSSATPHVRSAPVWQSNELLLCALEGMSVLCENNTILALHVANQIGMVSFLASLLGHKEPSVNLACISLVSALERSLVNAPKCSSTACTSLAHTDSPSLTQYLASIARPRTSLSRRNSASGHGHASKHVVAHRRNSIDSNSGRSPMLGPHHHHSVHHPTTPSSPAHKALHGAGGHFSPRLGGMHGPSQSLMTVSTMLSLTRREAHQAILALANRAVQTIVGIMHLQWPELRSRAPKVPLDSSLQQRLVDLLGSLVVHSEEMQGAACETVRILATLLANPTQSSSMRHACLVTLTSLCALKAENRQRVIDSRVLSNTIMPLLAVLKPLHQRRVKDCTVPIHPSVLQLQLASVQLCSSLAECFATLASSQLAAVSAAASGEAMGNLLLGLISFLTPRDTPLKLRVASVGLMKQLVSEHSPLRPLLVQAGIVPKLSKLAIDDGSDSGESTVACCALNFTATSGEECRLQQSNEAQCRYLSLSALANLTSHAPLAWKVAVIGELSIDGILGMIESSREQQSTADGAPTVAAHVFQQEQTCWTLLANLFEQCNEADVDGSEAGDVPAAESPPAELFSRYDLLRCMDAIQARIRPNAFASPSLNDPGVSQLLLTLCTRGDAKGLICTRGEILSYIYSLLQRTGEELKRAVHCVIYLLQATPEEMKIAPITLPPGDGCTCVVADAGGSSSPRPCANTVASPTSSSFLKRTQIIFSHELLPTFIALGRVPPMQMRDLKEAETSGEPSPVTPFVTYYIRRRIKQSLLAMYAHLKSSCPCPIIGGANWSLLEEYALAHQRRTSPVNSCASPDSPGCTVESTLSASAAPFHSGSVSGHRIIRSPPPRRRVRIHRDANSVHHVGFSGFVSSYPDCDEIVEEGDVEVDIDIEITHEMDDQIEPVPDDEVSSSEPDIYASSSDSSGSDFDDLAAPTSNSLSATQSIVDFTLRMARREIRRREAELQAAAAEAGSMHLTPDEILELEEAIEAEQGEDARVNPEHPDAARAQELLNNIITIQNRRRQARFAAATPPPPHHPRAHGRHIQQQPRPRQRRQ